jgi:hypothetical protein
VIYIRDMSGLGSEYVTEFGEFLGFDTDAKDDREFREPFPEWVPLSDVDVTTSSVYGTIADSIARIKEEMKK